jgi:8-oxo-dGTP pyrophosphatase MutT (NUDIX family)
MSAPISVDALRERIGRHRYVPITANEADLRAAVLVPFYTIAGRLYVVFTKRTMHMSMQKGHVSFPGGRREPGDKDLAATALRESQEEIGLDPKDVEILGRIDDFSTRDGSIFIAGFVGLIDEKACPYAWCPAEREVAEMLEVPVTHLLDPANVIVEPPRELNGRMWPKETFVFRGHRIFGATARAMRPVLDIAFG